MEGRERGGREREGEMERDGSEMSRNERQMRKEGRLCLIEPYLFNSLDKD